MNRIKKLREEFGYTQQDLAEKLNSSKSVIGLYESETRKPSMEVLIKLSEIFNCSIDYILCKSDIKNIDSVIPSSDKLFVIPVLGKIAAGQPILAEEYIEGYLPVDPNVYGLKNSEDLFYLKVSGQSMNMKIKNGDYALIRKQDTAQDGDIIVAIVNSDNEATLKRYKKLNEQFVLLEPMSTDPTIEAITVDLKNTKFQIIGKAIGQFGKF